MNRLNLVARLNAKLLAKLGLNELQANLVAVGSVGGDISDIKDEVNAENQLLAEETRHFVPIHEILDDFKNEDTYSNVKEDFLKSVIDKNPVYKNVKIRMGRMVINKETGERQIVHDDEVVK